MEKLSLCNYRNYEEAEVSFSAGINLVYGKNAQGKTNLLESIYLLCLGRSFRVSKNDELIREEASHFTISGSFILDSKLQKKVVVHCTRNGKKEISVDGKRLQRHSKLFGSFPIVVTSPDDYRISEGGPAERRKFVDILLSQVSVSYLTNLQEYHRILRQRNKLLQDFREGTQHDHGVLEPWSAALIEYGCQIMRQRFAFLREFRDVLRRIYAEYTQSNDELGIQWDASVSSTDAESELEDGFKRRLNQLRAAELATGRTLVGPHRDDLVLYVNGKPLRRFGSRGEHKSALISLKIAEYHFLKEKVQETPVVLLDDYYSELDDEREAKVFKSLTGLGQVFVTTPKAEIFEVRKSDVGEPGSTRRFYVQNGRLEQQA